MSQAPNDDGSGRGPSGSDAPAVPTAGANAAAPLASPDIDDESLRRLARELFVDTQQARELVRSIDPRDRGVMGAALRAVLDKLAGRD